LKDSIVMVDEPSPAGSGHPFLPGTASLVQEIDSKLCTPATYWYSYLATTILICFRKSAGCSQGSENINWVSAKRGSIW